GRRVVLIDNRLDPAAPPWSRREAADGPDAADAAETATAATRYACDLAGIISDLRPRAAPAIALRGVDFAYGSDRPIFRGLDLALEPGRAYRLIGRNGSGKTTFFKLLVGVLAPARGTILLDGAAYRPRAGGNRAFALATQNPDHQWCGATLAEDIARRRRALAGRGDVMPASDALLHSLARKLGVHAPDQHLYELPLAARKRLSWLWPFSGAMPWIMLDEPTVGQDRDTSAGLAAIVSRLCAIGYGVMLVTH